MSGFSNTSNDSRSKRQRAGGFANAVLPGNSREAPSLIDSDVYGEAVFGEAVYVDLRFTEVEKQLSENLKHAQRELVESTLASSLVPDLLIRFRLKDKPPAELLRPPFNAEYLLYFFLRKEERGAVIGDLLEEHAMIQERFSKRRADIWFCKQVATSLWPLFQRAVLEMAGLVWLGRMLRRLIS